MLVLGVETRASSQPVGSKSFAPAVLELNVGAVSTEKINYEIVALKTDFRKGKITTE